ncbi:hypothetical protein [Dyadobacter sp. CY343]|uniref:hypothetical protein n=1 Tax=Dyadobacter sp. CY343 TaxID=2907299 RepID=UPI001F19D56B|nr:hypothetical protein [Dyadobacter sp. CY343]MCE7062546.1 hypothetical protein [Dyadobacter sp. CY343]
MQLQRNLDFKLQSFGTRSAEAKKIVEYLYEQPVIDVSRIEAITEKSKATNYKLLADFERLEILQEVSGGQRNKLYVFKDYLDLFR